MLAVSLQVAVLLLLATTTQAETRWEAGAGLTSFHVPLYPGTEQTHNYLIPFPFVRIQSDIYEVTDGGVKGFFLDSRHLRLNVSGDLGVPVNNRDSRLRAGMANLDATLQLGPSMEIIFAGGRRQDYEFRLELPVRGVMSTDFTHNKHQGWVLEPRLTYESLRLFKQGWAGSVSAGARFASQTYHRYYYDVSTADVTVSRPAYQADAGYSGYFMDLVLNWRSGDWVYFGFVRYQNLSGAVFEDSPLVETSDYYAAGIGFSYVIGSKQP